MARRAVQFMGQRPGFPSLLVAVFAGVLFAPAAHAQGEYDERGTFPDNRPGVFPDNGPDSRPGTGTVPGGIPGSVLDTTPGTTPSATPGAAPGNTIYLPPPDDTPIVEGDDSTNLGGLFYRLQVLQQEVRQLRGIVERQSHEIRQLKQQSIERYQDLDRRLGAGGAPAGAAGGASAGASDVAPQTPELPGEADAYRTAYSLVRSRRFADAVGALNQFLLDYPTGRYAPNAHYWLGELHLAVTPRDLESSRRQFTLLINQYPDNAKVPDALYKLGVVYFENGNRGRAREYLNRVILEHGDSGSAAVRLARDFLNENF